MATVKRTGDPIAQTFYIKRGMGQGAGKVFLSKISLYFKAKSSKKGVSISIREVKNGYPTRRIVPFSEVHLEPDEISVSDDASAATTFVFDDPVALKVEKSYAFVVQPDGNNPDYLIWSSENGQATIDTIRNKSANDWGDGVLFTSTNNNAWTPVANEDLKFKMYRKSFSANNGVAVFTIDDYEFFHLNSVTGRFTDDELAYSLKSSALSNVTISANSSTITGSNFDVNFSVGDYIYITKGSFTDLLKIDSISNSSVMTVESPATFSNTGCTNYRAVAGEVAYFVKGSDRKLYLKNSSARSGNIFAAADVVYGFESGAEGIIDSEGPRNIQISFVQPQVYKSNAGVTQTFGKAKTTYSQDFANTFSQHTIPMDLSDNTYFNKPNHRTYLKSKSNDLSVKSFWLKVGMTSSRDTASPVVDAASTGIFAYEYDVVDIVGQGSNGYVSKMVELLDGFEADDFKLYLTAYRPLNTSISVYVKAKKAGDFTNFSELDWLPMKLVGENDVYSSSTDINDVREYEYEIDTTDYPLPGTYKYFAVKIVPSSLAGNGIVPMIHNYRAIALT